MLEQNSDSGRIKRLCRSEKDRLRRMHPSKDSRSREASSKAAEAALGDYVRLGHCRRTCAADEHDLDSSHSSVVRQMG